MYSSVFVQKFPDETTLDDKSVEDKALMLVDFNVKTLVAHVAVHGWVEKVLREVLKLIIVHVPKEIIGSNV